MAKLYTMFFKVGTKYKTEDSFPIPFTSKRVYFQWYELIVINFDLVRLSRTFSLVLYGLNIVYIADPDADIF